MENGSELEAIGMGGGVAQVMLQGSGGEPQVLQVLSLKDATVLTKAMVGMALLVIAACLISVSQLNNTNFTRR